LQPYFFRSSSRLLLIRLQCPQFV